MKKILSITILITGIFSLLNLSQIRAEEIRPAVCTERKNAVQKIEMKFKAEHQVVTGRYNKVIDNVGKGIQRLNELGYDTNEVNINIGNLKILVMDYNNKYLDFDNSLEALKESICTDNAKSELQETKKQLHSMIDKSREILDFFHSDLKPQLESIRKGK